MLKKLFLPSLLLIILISVFYPSKKENTKIFDYCYSLEKILTRNSIKTRENVSGKVNSISKDFLKFGVSKTRGDLISKLIDKYKASKNSSLINLIPTNIYCFVGYWIENIKPGTFESILYAKSRNTTNELIDLKNEVNDLLNNFNSEYKTIKKEFKSFF